MIFGFALFAIGYAILYWGIHHFPGYQRYSLWTLLGFGNITKIAVTSGNAVQFKS